MKKNWFVFEWAKKLGDYAIRWRLDFWLFSFRLHKWICSDDERAYHSHPVNMLIFICRGSYVDFYIDEHNKTHAVVYKAPCFRIIKRETRHYIKLVKSPTWSILFTWGVPKKWAFWLKYSHKRMNRDKYFLEQGHHICDQ